MKPTKTFPKLALAKKMILEGITDADESFKHDVPIVKASSSEIVDSILEDQN